MNKIKQPTFTPFLMLKFWFHYWNRLMTTSWSGYQTASAECPALRRYSSLKTFWPPCRPRSAGYGPCTPSTWTRTTWKSCPRRLAPARISKFCPFTPTNWQGMFRMNWKYYSIVHIRAGAYASLIWSSSLRILNLKQMRVQESDLNMRI